MNGADADTQDQVTQVIQSVHSRIAAFARESYQTCGRGVTLILVPRMAPGDELITTEMVYHTREAIERVAAHLDRCSESDDAAMLVRMIRTYDPSRQAVVIVRIVGQKPVSITMKLERPLVIDERPRIH